MTRLNRYNLTRRIFNIGLKKKSKEMTVGLVSPTLILDFEKLLIYLLIHNCLSVCHTFIFFQVRNDSIWDQLLFRKFVKDSAGLSRVRLMVVGSAPLDGSTLTFMRATLGCVVGS